MAQVLQEWPTISRTRQSKYPWSEWTDGEIRQVRKDEDFTSDVKTFVQGLYAYAKRHNMKVEVRTDADNDIAVFRFVAGAQSVNGQANVDEAPESE
jgi:hypothetical protein